MPTIGGTPSGPIVATSLVSGGDGYAVGDVISIPDEANGEVDAITPTGSSGPIISVSLLDGGNFWVDGDTFLVSGGSGDAEGEVDTIVPSGAGPIATTSLDEGGKSWRVGDTFLLGPSETAAGVVDTLAPAEAATGPIGDSTLVDGGNDWEVGDEFGVYGSTDVALGVVDSIGPASNGFGPIASSSINNPGVEWKVGDVFHVNTGAQTQVAVGIVDTIDGTSSGFDGSFVAGTISDGGSGYVVDDIVYVQPSGNAAWLTINSVDGGGAALTFTVTWMGKGYQTGIWDCDGGSGTGMQVNITEIAMYGSIVDYHLTSAGHRYEVLESFIVPVSPGFGSGATIDIESVGDSAIVTYHLTYGGIDYSIDDHDLSAHTGHGLLGTIHVDTVEDSAIATYHLTDSGQGYEPDTSCVVYGQEDSDGAFALIHVDSVVGNGPIATLHLTDPGTTYIELENLDLIATNDSQGVGASVSIDEVDPVNETGIVTDYHLEYTGEGSRQVGNEIELNTEGEGTQMSVRVDEIDPLPGGDGHVWLIVDYLVKDVL
jgi:hypothetical protein